LGNIPVKNGVVHLIHRPLMVVDTTVAKFLEVRKSCSKFSSLPFFGHWLTMTQEGKLSPFWMSFYEFLFTKQKMMLNVSIFYFFGDMRFFF